MHEECKKVCVYRDLKTLYYSMNYPYLTFGIDVWGGAKKGLTEKICILQKSVVRGIGLEHYLDHSLPIFKRLHILKFTNLYERHILKQVYLFHHDLVPTPIRQLFCL